MKLSKLFVLLSLTAFGFMSASAQDPSINVVLGSSGVTSVGGNIFLQVDVTNNDAITSIVANKTRPQISVPTSICSISLIAGDHILPSGWTIITNNGSAIKISNTTDAIPAGTTRTAYIAIKGTVVGSGSINANMTYNGPAPSGDNTANNTSSAGLTVTGTTPVTLTDFKISLLNCQPVLNWITENEINSERAEIERTYSNNSNWTYIGELAAIGNSTQKNTYNFIDKTLSTIAQKVLYRIKMIDKDGRYKYSEVLRVNVNCNIPQVDVYPNPVQNGKLNVGITGTKGYTEATLLSLSGQVIVKKQINNGTNFLNVLNIANGTYLLNVKDANGVDKKEKVLIQY